MRARLAPIGLGVVVSISLGCAACASAKNVEADSGLDGGLPACGLACGPEITPESLDASLAVRVEARLALCNGQEGCHVSGAGGLFYPPGNARIDLVDVPASERPDLYRVKPGDPIASYLYLKVRGDGGIEGGAMPLGGSPRDPRIADTIFAWIEAGAPGE
jgi:hypothetical protein